MFNDIPSLMCAISDAEDGTTGELERLNKTITILINFLRMKRKLLFLMVMFAGLFANAQETSVLDIEGLAVSPEATATKSYFLKNVGTGLYMSYGGEWGFHCIETNAAHPVVLESHTVDGESYVAIGSLVGYLESNTLWMDSTKNVSKWKLEKAQGYSNQYYLVGDGDRVLTSVGNSAGLLGLDQKATKPAKASQRWVFLDDADINKKMSDATAENPLDVTPFIKAATFDIVDTYGNPIKNEETNPKNANYFATGSLYQNAWTNYSKNCRWPWDYFVDPERSWDASKYNFCGVVDAGGTDLSKAVTVSQKITLPAGTYYFSFESMYRYCEKFTTREEEYNKRLIFSGWDVVSGTTVENNTADSDKPATLTLAGTDVAPMSFIQNTNLPILDYPGSAKMANATFRNNDDFKQNAVFTLSKQTEVTFNINIPAKDKNPSDSYSGQTAAVDGNIRTYRYDRMYISTYAFDDFILQYFGDATADQIDHSNLYVPYIEANIAEYKEYFNEAGDAALDEFMASIDLNAVDTKEEYYNAIATLNAAYAYAQLKHDEQLVADLSGVIINNSFEMGNLTGWTVVNKDGDTEVRQGNAGGTYGTAGIDGTYLYNTWRINHDTPGCKIGQVVKALPKGKYTLKVLVATDKDRSVTITGNKVSTTHTIVGDGATFEEAEVTFNVGNDGLAEISAEGSGWFKVDNFRLVYLGNKVDLSQENTVLNYEDKDFATLVTIDRTMPNSNWSTLVVPFNMAIPAGWDVREFTSSFLNGDNNERLNLHFAKTDKIEAGVPYLVRQTSGSAAAFPEVIKDVTLKADVTSVETDVVAFTGTFVKSEIPAGAYYLSGNKFYKTTSPVATKGFRAWFVPKDANVKMLSFSFDEEGGATDIEDVQGVAEEPVVVAVYGIDGTLRTEMQKGLNIVKMSNGTVKKVFLP